MKISEATPKKLIIQHRRPMWAVVMAIFTIISLFSLVNLLLQGVSLWAGMDGFQRIAFFIWSFLALGLVLVGISITHNAGLGMLIDFDKTREIVTLRLPNIIRASQHEYPIYGISHLHIERNEEVRVVGIFLVLRHGERIALGTVTPFDVAEMQQLAREVRAFLQG